MEIVQTQAGASPATRAAAEPAKGVISSDFETFLRMLTVQMQNQDPLDPIKSEDYAVQLATFSGVEQQVRTNELLSALGSQFGLMGMSQMAGWVGKQARAPVAGYFDGTPITLSSNPPAIADRVDLIVRDQTGRAVERVAIAAQGGAMEWTGQAADGTAYLEGLYQFEIESFSNGASVGLSPVDVYATVTEARAQDGQTILVLRGGVEIAATEVTALRDPAMSA